MRWLETVFHLGYKELASLARDAALVGLIIYAFTYAVYGPAKGARMELRNASVGIVDEDHSLLSARIRDGLQAPYFVTPQYIDLHEVDSVMDRGKYTFTLVIPMRFQANVAAGRRPTVQLNVDATAMSQAGRGAEYIASVLESETAKFLNMPPAIEPVRLVTRMKFNPNLTDTWFVSIAQIVNNITLLAIILAGAAVVREREHGTIEHLLVMPVRPNEIMLAKVWANAFAIVSVATLSLVVIVKGVLQVPIAGSVVLFTLGAALYLFASTSLGILLATIARSMPQFGLLAFIVYLVLDMLSGNTTPLDSMPRWLETIMQGSPTTHFVDSSLAILYRGADLAIVWKQFAVVVLIGAICFGIALSRFRRMLALMQNA
jgi:ABC-2 type transport system permease protein